MSPGTYEFGALIDGGVLAVGDGYRAKNDELGGDGPIFLRAGHVGDGVLDLEGTERFRVELTPRLGAKASRRGDVLVVTKGWSTGRVAHVGPSHPPMIYSPHTCFWRSLDPNEIDPGFLRYWSRGHEAQSQMASFRMATDVHPYLSLVAQRKLRITIPSLPVQKAAGGILGALDDKIELNRRTNETLEAIARAIFQSWFVDFDPVRAKMEGRQPEGMDAETAKLFPSSLDEAEWRTVAELERDGLLLIGDGYRAKNSELGPTGLPFARAADVVGGQVSRTEDHLLEEHIPLAGEKIARPGDVVFTSKGTVGRFALIRGGAPFVYSPQLCFWRSLSSRLPPLYLFQWMESPEFVHQVNQVKGQTDMADYVSLRDQRAMRVRLPSEKVLPRFVSIVSPIDAKLDSLRSEARTLAELRDTLLPKLLSGELRVPDAERAVADAL